MADALCGVISLTAVEEVICSILQERDFSIIAARVIR
jgi:hypothetical protein